MKKSDKNHQNQSNSQAGQSALVEVLFTLQHSKARDIFLCGDFNQWSPSTLRMIRQGASDRWEKRLTLPPGRYEYKFLVDGAWTADPSTRNEALNAFGSINSILDVHP